MNCFYLILLQKYIHPNETINREINNYKLDGFDVGQPDNWRIRDKRGVRKY